MQKVSDLACKVDALSAKLDCQAPSVTQRSQPLSPSRRADVSPPPSRPTVTPSPTSFNSNFRRTYGAWPENLFSLKQKLLSDVLFQYFWEDLALAEIPQQGSPGRRAYELVRQCLGICIKFADLSTIPQFPKKGTAEERKLWSAATTSFVQQIEQDVTRFINETKRKDPSRLRDRLVGGTVSAIVKAWDKIPVATRNAFVPTRIVYSQFTSSSLHAI